LIGYTGRSQALPILIDGLTKLEYRGYDSAGVSVFNQDQTHTTYRSAGKLSELQKLTETSKADGMSGIGHTRWATHGPPTDGNAHPHLGGGCAKGQGHSVAVVHNGVVENYHSIKARLEVEGYVFQSETDSEVIAHLIDSCLKQIFSEGPRLTDDVTDSPYVVAVRKAIGHLRGTHGESVTSSVSRGPSEKICFRQLSIK
jgi:glucosamine--fructose-6-phosphate aminotransferase (isomerizing)